MLKAKSYSNYAQDLICWTNLSALWHLKLDYLSLNGRHSSIIAKTNSKRFVRVSLPEQGGWTRPSEVPQKLFLGSHSTVLLVKSLLSILWWQVSSLKNKNQQQVFSSGFFHWISKEILALAGPMLTRMARHLLVSGSECPCYLTAQRHRDAAVHSIPPCNINPTALLLPSCCSSRGFPATLISMGWMLSRALNTGRAQFITYEQADVYR